MKKSIAMLLLCSLMAALILSGCAGAEERNLQAGEQALAREDYAAAASAFEKAGGTPDALRLLHYAMAFQALEAEDYAGARSGFQGLGDFRDSALMIPYTGAREQEARARASQAAGDADAAAEACLAAVAGYGELTFFRDCDQRSEACRELLYNGAVEWMDGGRYADAASAFAALGDWRDCAGLRKYCEAAELETQGSFPAAAALFAEVPEVRDASARAEAALQQAYRDAEELLQQKEYEAAAAAFAALGDYRDAASQAETATVSLVRTRLQAGSFAEALEKLSQLKDPASVFPAAEPAEAENLNAYLHSFLNTWMTVHSGIMTAFFANMQLEPYLEPGGELDTRVRAELVDDGSALNYGFQYLNTDVRELLRPDEGFTAARVRASASWYSATEGPVEVQPVLWVLLDSRQGNPVVAAVLEEAKQG